MKQRYRNFLLVFFFCLSASSVFAVGHTVTITSQVNVSCFGGCNGSANTSVSGGVGPFTYSWAPAGGTAANATGLCPGTYTVTATDQSDGSTATATVMITQPTQMTLNMTTNNALCWGGWGSATALISGGTPGYTYLWNPPGSTSATINNVPAGNYGCTVTDANGCVVFSTVTITEPPMLNVTTMATPTSICSNQSSVLTTTVTGGIGNYTFSWSPTTSLNFPTSSNPTASPTTTTTYTILVTDANGCVATNSVTVNVNQAIAANISSTNATCNQSNGSLTINITQAASPYSLTWSNSQTTPTINGLSAGTYTCSVMDANGCTDNFVGAVSNIGGPTVTTSSTNASCTNYNNGTATANASGIAPITYSWNSSPVQTTSTASNLASGNYICTVTDSAGCVTIVSQQVNALAGNLFMYAFPTAVAFCAQSTGCANTVVQGGTQPYAYLWSNASTNSTLTNVASGNYTVTVTDSNGCAISGMVNVPSTCANYIEGRVYVDLNQNSVYDASDYPLSGALVGITPYVAYAASDANGMYRIWAYSSGTFDVSFTNNTMMSVSVPAGGHHYPNFPAMGDSALNLDFALTYASPFQNLYLSLASGPARPGFTQTYSIHCQNLGVTTVSDTIWFRHDSILTLISATPVFDGYAHPEGYWLFNNFTPGQHIYKNISLQVPTIPNGGYIGRQLIANARIEPMASDTTSPDNGDDEVDIITAAYDPNLKESWSPTMNEYGDIWPMDLELDYTIHFQNSGTDTAFTVVVVDTLPSQLDITTFRMGASSHPCTYTINGYNGINEVTFTFMNILLPDSNVNEPASHGFVQFTIDRYPNLPIGTTILNEANNYFDFNPAIVTNMDTVTITDPLLVAIPQETGFAIYPNPANESVNIALSQENIGQNTVIVLRDLSGREILRTPSNGNATTLLDVRNFAAGIYTVTVECADHNSITQKLIITEK